MNLFALISHPSRRRQWHPTPVLLPGKSHGWRSLVGCSPWGCYKSDRTERLHFQFSLSCIGGGNGNPHQCSCLENPRDRGAWWPTVYGVAQSRTWLKRLSSSSSRDGAEGTGGKGTVTANGYRVFFWGGKGNENVLKLIVTILWIYYKPVNPTFLTEILWYLNHISIELLFKKKVQLITS